MRQLARSLTLALAVVFALAPTSADAQKSRAVRRAKIAKPKRKAPISNKKVVMLVGMPGSGKSFVSKKLADKLGLPKPLVSGDVIREAAGKAKNPKEQGERVLAVARKFAKMKGEIGRRMALKAKRLKGDTVIIEGFRNPHDLVAFKKAFPNTVVVSLDVPDGLRHERQLARGRAGEDNVAYLKKRDAQERKQGVGKLMKGADLRVKVTSNDPRELDRVLTTLGSQIAGGKASVKAAAH